ncbi:MFS family permease [Deinobacterium chartae]|uniref:MFS family permease n=1 Tax=Deinobacterium chartae TaxID=521158 RepID=A0A841HZE4_9DEIO|nr:MFS transporter [Deinobacterium chartae]MBB6098767.1 MFS family permease [Deinobacterium chartae]
MTRIDNSRLTLLLIASLTVMSGAIIAPGLPAMRAHFAAEPHADVLVRLVLTIVGLAIALTAPLIGWLLDRVGRRPVLIAGLVLYTLSGASGLIAQTLPQVMVGRLILGVAVAALMTAGSALASDLFHGRERARFLSQQSAFTNLGGVVFIPLAGLLATLSWRAPFIAYLLPLLLLPLTLALPRHTHVTPDPARPAQTDRIPWNAILIGYATAFLYMLVFYLIPSQLPFRLAELGANSTSSGLLLGTGTLAGGITGLAYARFAGRLVPTRAAGLGLLLLATGWFIIHLAPTLPLTLLGLIVGSIGGGITLPNINTWIAHLAPPHARGRVLAGLTSSTFLAQFLSPLAAAPLIAAGGIPHAFTFGTLLALALAATLLLLPEHVSSGRRQSGAVLEAAAD